MSIAMGVILLTLGFTSFTSIYNGFMVDRKSDDKIVLSDEITEIQYYDKADIFYTYTNFKQRLEDGSLEGKKSIKMSLYVNNNELKYDSKENEILELLNALGDRTYEKTYIYKDEDLEQIKFVSR